MKTEHRETPEADAVSSTAASAVVVADATTGEPSHPSEPHSASAATTSTTNGDNGSSAASTAAKKKKVRRRRTDGKSLEVALTVSSLLLWVPYSLAAIYLAYCRSFFIETEGGVVPVNDRDTIGYGFLSSAPVATLLSNSRLSHPYSRFYYYIFPEGFDIAAFIPNLLYVLAFSALAISSTYYCAVHWENSGEVLMLIAWFLGVMSEAGWLTSTGTYSGLSGTQQGAPMGGVNATAISGADPSMVMYVHRIPTPPVWMWIFVSIITGFFSGILCKVKDVVDGRCDRETHLFSFFDRRRQERRLRAAPAASSSSAATSGEALEDGVETVPPHPRRASHGTVDSYHQQRASYTIRIGDRLYIVVPFCTGQWLYFILKYGWRGIFVENIVIVLSLGMIGYTMLSVQLIKQQMTKALGHKPFVRQVPVSRSSKGSGPVRRAGSSSEEDYTVVLEEEGFTVDVIDLVTKLFTTSFGGVVLAVLVLNVFLSKLLIPFLKALFTLNALSSSVGIIVELLVYEVA